MLLNRLRLRQRRGQYLIHGDLQAVINFFFQPIDFLFVEDAFANQEQLHARNGIASSITLALNIGPVQLFVIRK